MPIGISLPPLSEMERPKGDFEMDIYNSTVISTSLRGEILYNAIGLMHWKINGYKPSDIEVAAAFGIDARKVGENESEPPLDQVVLILKRTGAQMHLNYLLVGLEKVTVFMQTFHLRQILDLSTTCRYAESKPITMKICAALGQRE